MNKKYITISLFNRYPEKNGKLSNFSAIWGRCLSVDVWPVGNLVHHLFGAALIESMSQRNIIIMGPVK